MSAAPDLLGLLTEVFTWVGFGGAAMLWIIALVAAIADGTWLPARGAVEDEGGEHIVRWFDADGNVNEAPLSPEQATSLNGEDMIDIWYRRGWMGRMRLHKRAHAVRALAGVGTLLAAVGALSTIVQLIILAVAS